MPIVRIPHCLITQAWIMRFNLTYSEARCLTSPVLRQLSQCRTEEARRLLLGKSS